MLILMKLCQNLINLGMNLTAVGPSSSYFCLVSLLCHILSSNHCCRHLANFILDDVERLVGFVLLDNDLTGDVGFLHLGIVVRGQRRGVRPSEKPGERLVQQIENG